MTKRAFDSIRQGLAEAIQHAEGGNVAAKVYQPKALDVAALRARMDMTQEQFAARFGFSVSTLRHWERGDRKPAGAALVLLNVIERDPHSVLRALG